MDDPSYERVERYVASVVKDEVNLSSHIAACQSEKLLADVCPGLVDSILYERCMRKINVLSANEVKSKTRHSKHAGKRGRRI